MTNAWKTSQLGIHTQDMHILSQYPMMGIEPVAMTGAASGWAAISSIDHFIRCVGDHPNHELSVERKIPKVGVLEQRSTETP